ncbi:MAG: hypothetical protein KC418_00485 [Anaerolineales bacterium]|nr:hypothetical protein [Anaerolineales bacterium]MCB8954411.1 hypothetical protein [Ardenticatenales bacterium]
MKIISNRFSIVLYCVLFNLLFEYSARGLAYTVSRPLFYLFMAGIYTSYYAILEDLIVRFKLTNLQIALFSLFWSFYPTTFITNNLINAQTYGGRTLLGINLGAFLFILFFAWPFLQGIFTFYLANRLVPRDWDHPRMGVIGYALAIGYLLIIPQISNRAAGAAGVRPITYIAVLLLMAGILAWFILSVRRDRKRPAPAFEALPFMDFLVIASVVVLFALGTFFYQGRAVVTTQPLSQRAVVIQHGWLALSAVAFLIYRLFIRRRDVVV